MPKLLSVVIVCVLGIVAAAAQETRGNISGTVQDAQGVVPGATVRITNVDTNTTQTFVTNNTGYFEAPLLQPGNYRIVVEMAGFKTVTRDGVALAVGQQVNMPFTLEVGNISEQVTVTGVAPVLDTTSVSSGANFDTQQINALPMFSNMPVGLARFAPGVNPDADQPPMSQGFVTGPSEASGTSIGGVGSNTYTIDGATNAGFNRQLSTSPNADMVQEMRVETSNFDASNGHGLGNQISMMTRAGTNVTRGTINYQYWTNRLNALNVQQKQTFNDVALEAFRAGRSHNSAFTLGGPLHIPKLVDGRGKAFFFANYSYVSDSIPGRNQGNNTVPANDMHLQGDFSDLLRLPNPNQYIIYDPLTARPDPANPNRVIRTPFPDNVIPRDRIFNPDGTYRNKLFGLYAAAAPKANQNFVEQGQQPQGNYYRGAEPSIPVSHLFGLRLDYNLSSADRLFLRGSGSRYHEDVDDWTFESPTPEFRGLHDSDRDRYTWSYTGNWTRAFGQTVLDTQLSANKFYTLDKNHELTKYKPTDFGLPSYLDQFCESKGVCQIPRVIIGSGANGFYQQLSKDVNRQSDETTNVQGQFNATQVRGAHTLRGGVDVRRAMRGRMAGGNASGLLTFTRDYTRQASDEALLTPSDIGLSLAAFMLGVPTTIQLDDQVDASLYNHYVGTFAQDSWRVTRNLTLNAGLRFEYEDGIREKDDRMLVGFEPDALTSISQAAEAAYLASGVASTPGMLPSISVRGGSLFATDPGQPASWKGQAMWMPRVSAAYKLGERMVLKGGWGLYYDTLNAGDVTNGTVVSYQTGYGVSTVTGNSADLGRTFVYNVNTGQGDPFPVRANGSRFDTPIGSSLGADTLLGTTYTDQNLDREHTRQQRWRVSVQRELASNLGLEVAYNGSYSDRIDRTIRADYLPEEYWNGSNERNTTANSFLTAQVSNPFRIQNFEFLTTSNPALYSRLAGNTFFTQQTTQRNRLLRSFPQMSAGNGLMLANVPVGIVKVHSLEVVLNRRFANGLTGVFSFSANSVRENRIVEEYDREPTLWQGSNGGRPYRITASAAYDLPLGAGRAFLNDGGVLAAIVGGWQLAGNYDYQPGALLDWNTNLFFYGDLDDIAADNPTLDRWFNVDAGFEKDPAKTPAAFQKRQFPFRVDAVRGQALSFLNMSVARSLRVGSARTVQLRVDAQNVLNRQHWQNANTNPTSTNFGMVTAVTQNYMRFITFGMRLNF
jgi:hypothetical protein